MQKWWEKDKGMGGVKTYGAPKQTGNTWQGKTHRDQQEATESLNPSKGY